MLSLSRNEESSRQEGRFEEQTFIVSLGFGGGVGIILGGMFSKIDSGCIGRRFPLLSLGIAFLYSKFFGQCAAQTTVSFESVMLSLGIAFLHLSFSFGSCG